MFEKIKIYLLKNISNSLSNTMYPYRWVRTIPAVLMKIVQKNIMSRKTLKSTLFTIFFFFFNNAFLMYKNINVSLFTLHYLHIHWPFGFKGAIHNLGKLVPLPLPLFVPIRPLNSLLAFKTLYKLFKIKIRRFEELLLPLCRHNDLIIVIMRCC